MTLYLHDVDNNNDCKYDGEYKGTRCKDEPSLDNWSLPGNKAQGMCAKGLPINDHKETNCKQGYTPCKWMIDGCSSIYESRRDSFECCMCFTCVPDYGCLIKVDKGHGESNVFMPVIAQGGVSEQHDDVCNHVGDAAPHSDLMEHFANNPESR